MVAQRRTALSLAAAALLLAGGVEAQQLYKYRDGNGNWQFSDRPPADASQPAEAVTLKRPLIAPQVVVQRDDREDGTTLYAVNEFFAPVQFELALTRRGNLDPASPPLIEKVLAPRQRTLLAELRASRPGERPQFAFRYRYLPGDPGARHQPEQPYRVPYAVGQSFRITQAYPVAITHDSDESRYAVDFAMPVGTGVYAARGGRVLSIVYKNTSGGTDRELDLPKANTVSIVHDDGTIATYAHLRHASIRVRPGDRVERGEYIADSGNTGFTTGPHLHFSVDRNVGFATHSLPVEFSGAGGSPVAPRTGEMLTAY